MSYMKMLSDTYEQNKQFAADYTQENLLCPVSHMEVSAQIELTIDVQGNFQSAAAIEDKKEANTIIPVTERAASRSSKEAPYSLCDNLYYVAGDYRTYAGTEKEADFAKIRFDEYVNELENWKNSSYSDRKVESVYLYVKKECMIKDLIRAGIVIIDESGKFSNKRIAGKSYGKCIVRFRVLGAGQPSECWKDKQLMEKYQRYYGEVQKRENRYDFCYLTGKYDIISDNHPKGILEEKHNAKLLSSNDSSNFTFRGRFSESQEAYAVSYDISQKAHNALRWLVKQQGYSVGDSKNKRYYVCWNPKGKDVIRVDEPLGYLEDEEEAIPTTKREYKEKLRKTINGYRNQFEETDDIALMVLEAATKGRLSITYYNELKARDFFDRIQQWNERCCWMFEKTDKYYKKMIRTPSIKEVVNYAFGAPRKIPKKKKTKKDKEDTEEIVEVDGKLMIMQYQRLFQCIVDKKPMPRDFVEAIFQRVSRLLTYSDENRERLLSISCALIAKFYYDKKGEKIKMEVDRNNEDRSYLYGRLLAVYETVERSTYEEDEKRDPNAIRLQAAYTQRPAMMRAIIEEALIPYYQRLKPAKREFYRREIEEISNKIKIDKENRPLEYMYIVGYWAERADLRLNQKEEK